MMRAQTSPVRILKSAGGVVFRRNVSGFEVALVSVKGGNVWTLPKGLINKGESPRDTALREVAEETGLNGRITDGLGEITYWYVAKDKETPAEYIRYKKTVYFFLMEYLSGDTAGHDYEVDECAWFPLEQAAEMVTYKGDKEMLEKAKELIGRGK
ncbi:MAG: NUDIX hydrolase [Actinomycetota bacterium]|nr:NUDIX hydrolase [Actinomycetota bacterium]